jgi:hypothetical protein
VDGVNAYAHDLGILLGKSCDLRIHCRELRGSDWGPVGDQEGKNDVLLSAIITQPQSVSLGSRHCLYFKVWSDISYISRTHGGSSDCFIIQETSSTINRVAQAIHIPNDGPSFAPAGECEPRDQSAAWPCKGE